MPILANSVRNLVLLFTLSGADQQAKACADRDARFVPCETQSAAVMRNSLGDNSFRLWPDGVVPYTIEQGFPNTSVQVIEDAILDFNDLFEGCVSWRKRTFEAVYVMFVNDGGCKAQVGRAYWPFTLPQTVNLGGCSDLVGHVKHEMMHTLGFFHEHSRSDRDLYVKIHWSNVIEGRRDQFETNRWTTAMGEPYDYDSIMHYPAQAFSKHPNDPDALTIEPRNATPLRIGRRTGLSAVDVVKIKKLYKCEPYTDWRNDCREDAECGVDEFCDWNIWDGWCRTLLADGEMCWESRQCLHFCTLGRCSSCRTEADCRPDEFCANEYLPLATRECRAVCGSPCLTSSGCGGHACTTCDESWRCTAPATRP